MQQPFQQYANVRPTRIFRGTQSPLRNASHGDLDWVIVRENSEGEYAGQGGRSHKGQPWEIATEVFHLHKTRCRAVDPLRLRAGAEETEKVLDRCYEIECSEKWYGYVG